MVFGNEGYIFTALSMVSFACIIMHCDVKSLEFD